MKFGINKSVSFKFITAFLILIVIPVIVLCIIFANVYMEILVHNSQEKCIENIKRSSTEINNDLINISIITSKIAHNVELMQLLTEYNRSRDPVEKFKITEELDSLLDLIFDLNNFLEIGIFYYKDTGSYSYRDFPLTAEENIRARSWYINAIEHRGFTFILPDLKGITQTSKNEYVLSVYISPTVAKTGVELVYLSFKNNYLQYLINSISTKNNGLIILDENNKVLLSRTKDNIGVSIKDLGYEKIDFSRTVDSAVYNISGKKLLISYSEITKTCWKILSIVDYNSITIHMYKYNILAIIMFVIIFSIFLIYSLVFFFNIIKPIKKLTDEIKLVEKGHFKIKEKLNGPDEISRLNKAFYQMVKKLDMLTLEKEQKEKQRLKAELEALQFQINPHFIANTLNSIRLMAMISKNDNIKRMIDGLIKFFSFIYRWESNLVQVDEIISNIKTYIYIMKVRFGDKFKVKYKIDENAKSLYILKMILQPVIENAIVHGISNRENNGIIEITAHPGNDFLFINVKDNGAGMNENKIDEVLNGKWETTQGLDKNIGIINVIKRIKLNHGPRYGLEIQSEEGFYTNVTYVLPVIKELPG